MRMPFYKSLDREFEIFGIKGRWVTTVLAGAGAAVVLGVIVGSVTSSLIGIAVVVIGIVVVFFGAVTLQVKLPSRQIGKKLVESKVPGWIVRRETLCRIIMDDPMYGEVKEYLSGRSPETKD